MKKGVWIVIFLLLSTTLCAQHYVGVRGGWGGGSARYYPPQEMGYEWGLPSGGISWKYYSAEKVLGGVQIDLQYLGRGLAFDLERNSDTSYHRRFASIDLPIMWQPHFYLFSRHVRLFINLGLNLSYNLDNNSTYKYVSKKKGVYDEGPYKFSLTRDVRWGYGLCGGAGLGVLAGRFEFLVEGRYYFGYSDVLRNKNKYETNPVRSPLDNINISLGIYYRLGKGDILAPPGKKLAQKRLARESKTLNEESNEQ